MEVKVDQTDESGSVQKIEMDQTMKSSTSHDLYNHRNNKIPLAIMIHHNFFLSPIFTIIAGNSAFAKSFDSLLLSAFWTWVIVEASRLYCGQKGMLMDSVPALWAFLLLSIFPQLFIVVYMGFLQNSILPLDRWTNAFMATIISFEIVLTAKLLRSTVTTK